MKLFLVAVVLATTSYSAAAGNIAAGKQKSASCAGCHGISGVSNNPAWPNLAGQKLKYLEKQMKDFRDGKRNDPLMSPMVKNLTDEDINNIAAYFSSLKN